MNRFKNIALGVLPFFLSCAATWAATITYTINAGASGTTILPYTYGSNDIITNNPQSTATPTTILFNKNPLYRQGGDRLTAYNWENNASNSGMDYCATITGVVSCNHEDNYLFPPGVTYANDQPATTLIAFIQGNNALSAASLVTLQMAGYVSINPACNCFVSITGPADTTNAYWAAVSFTGGPTTGAPVTNGTVVYMNQEMAYLLSIVGGAGSGGALFYDLDNEPALWPDTHPMVHPNQTTCAEVSGKGITLAGVITAADPNAQILGPVAYGWSEYVNNQSAPDCPTTYTNSYGVTYLCYYLQQMNSASSAAGHRLLHYLDLHWYPAATTAVSDPNYITTNDTSYGMSVARMQAPRSLWDPSYTEVSWITAYSTDGPITLIPRLQAAINQYYPGTGLSFSEYQYGAGEDISGGVAQADALGIFGEYGAIACRWDDGTDNAYVAAAYNLYLDYDGAGSSFGNLSMPATSSSVTLGSVYASRSTSVSGKIWVAAIDRDCPASISGGVTYSGAVTDTAQFTLNNIPGGQVISSIRSFRFDATNSTLYQPSAPTIASANNFTDSLPGRSGTLYEITLGNPTPTPTLTPTFTPSATPTGTWYTSTPTHTITSTATPTPAVPDAVLFPNPVKGQGPLGFYYNVTSPVNQVKVKIFTVALRKIFEDDTLSAALGQNKYTLNMGQGDLNVANGLYYVVLELETGSHETRQIMKLLVQR